MTDPTQQAQMDAYERLTRTLTNMHHSERTLLDNAGSLYSVLMETVSIGGEENDAWAAATAEKHFRTAAGDAWRAKRGLIGEDGAFFN